MTTSIHTRVAVAFALGAVAMFVACSGTDDPTSPEQPADGASFGLVVSEPVLAQAAGADGNATAAGTSQELSYVSLPPGSFPTGETATFTNLMSGGSHVALLVDGGFDPVSFPAVVGDTVETTILTDDGTIVFRMVNEVPARMPPIIVRTNPEEGKVDVVFSVAPIVVFSEPMDGQTVTDETIQLLLDGEPVDGVVTISDDGLRGEFTPSEALAPRTMYTLVITTGVVDRSGDQLESQDEVAFTTRRALDPGPILFERFVVGPGGTNEILASEPDGSNPVFMEEGREPAWSPDGSKILFYRDGNIHVMNADGSDIVEVSQNAGRAFRDPGYSWSPDGSRIVLDKSDGIYAMNADGTGAVKLTDQRGAPSWSPDGSKIAIVTWWSFNVTAEIHVMNADGSAEVNLTNNPAQDNDVAWSPDGSKIAFVSDRDVTPRSGGNIYVMNADGSNLVRLRPRQPNEHGFYPAWSPDGSMIAFSHRGSGAEDEIYVINADGTAEVNLTNDPGTDRFPAWSPDGKQIVFSSYRETPVPGDGPLDIYVMNTDGSDVRRITSSDDALDWSPQWRR